MGNKGSGSEKHLLHYHKLDENKLWVFYPRNENYAVYPVFTETGPFFFGNLETISVPSLNRIYVVGGTGFKKMPEFTTGDNTEDLSKYQKKEGESEANEGVQESQFEEPTDLTKDTLYARAEKAAEYMTPVPLVGYIQMDGAGKEAEKLTFTDANVEQLAKARTSHSMIFCDPYLYVIGGIIDNNPTNSCVKLHVKDHVWTDMTSIGFYGNLSSPAVIAFGRHIYVFDCYSEEQAIHKYQMDFDIWESIPFETPGFKIPKSLNSMLFKYSFLT